MFICSPEFFRNFLVSPKFRNYPQSYPHPHPHPHAGISCPFLDHGPQGGQNDTWTDKEESPIPDKYQKPFFNPFRTVPMYTLKRPRVVGSLVMKSPMYGFTIHSGFSNGNTLVQNRH